MFGRYSQEMNAHGDDDDNDYDDEYEDEDDEEEVDTDECVNEDDGSVADMNSLSYADRRVEGQDFEVTVGLSVCT